MEVDHSVERVINALKAKGLDENMMVIFSSDHGPAPYAGNILKATPAQIHQLEALGHYPSGLHRGYKFSAYKGGLRVPLIARWPGVIPEGQTSDALQVAHGRSNPGPNLIERQGYPSRQYQRWASAQDRS